MAQKTMSGEILSSAQLMSPLSATEEWMNLVVIRDVEFVTSANSIYHCLK